MVNLNSAKQPQHNAERNDQGCGDNKYGYRSEKSKFLAGIEEHDVVGDRPGIPVGEKRGRHGDDDGLYLYLGDE